MSKHHKEEAITETTETGDTQTAPDTPGAGLGSSLGNSSGSPGATEEASKGESQDPGNAAAGNAGGSSAGDAGESACTADAAGKCADSELTAEEKVAELEVKLAEANDQYLRKAADFENFRKRMNQEKQNAIDFANQSLLLDLITVIDDFERALKADDANYTSLREGIGMIEKNLVSQLENKWGLKRFDSAGEPFDPNRHEAIMMEKSAEIDEPVVAEDFIKGYILKDRVIRPAKVKVVMPENK